MAEQESGIARFKRITAELDRIREMIRNAKSKKEADKYHEEYAKLKRERDEENG